MMYFPRYQVVHGQRHLARGEPCQDTAYAVEGDDFAIVAVSDGVSSARMSQVGSALLCHAAVYALQQELQAGHIDRVDVSVRHWLTRFQQEIQNYVGRAAAEEMLPATLVIGVIHDQGAEVWAAGDGEAFISAGARSVLARSTSEVTLIDGSGMPAKSSATAKGYLWSRGGRYVKDIPYDLIRAPSAQIPAHVMSVSGAVNSIYVATDGLAEAPRVQGLLRTQDDAKSIPVRELLTEARTRDDACVAWATNTFRRQMGRASESLPRFSSKEERQAQHIADRFTSRGVTQSIGSAAVQARRSGR